MAQIQIAQCYVLEYSLGGYKLSYGTIDKLRNVVLKLTDADGVFGWGEANPQQPFTDESVEDVTAVLEKDLLPALWQQDSSEPSTIDDILDEKYPGHLVAKGAITMALLDIQGKRQGVPVAKLLGSIVHTSLPVLWPLSDQDVTDDIRLIDEKLHQGYKTFMLKMGQRAPDGDANIARQASRVKDLHSRYGTTIKLIADANTGWTVAETQAFLAQVPPHQLIFLEQPIDKTDIPGLAKLSQESHTPISADESVTSHQQASALLSAKACSIFSIKSSKNGGPLRAQKLCDLAERHGVKVYMNSMLELGITQAASLQLAVTRDNLVDAGHAYMSTLRLTGDPTNFGTFVRDGVVYLPDAPGLGIEVDEDKVRKMAVGGFVLKRQL